jgi:hypothetical protein
MNECFPSRRQLLARAGQLGVSVVALSALSARAAEDPDELPKGSADSCIFLWLGGGACHIDTFDPKRRGDGKKVAGSYYDAIPTAAPGVRVCEHLRHTAAVMDRVVPVRTLHHDVIDEHTAAVHRVHTGRRITESVMYPSVGSVVAHELGPRSANVPSYVVIGYPNVSRGPGFLGSKAGYVYLTETDAGPAGLTRPADVDAARQARREELLAKLRTQHLRLHPGDKPLYDYATTAAEGFRLAGPDFMNVFDLKTESADLRRRYGGEFGQRCLLARRLVQAGVRFVEVSFNLNFINGTGWDTHKEGQLNQHLLIRELDQALATLITDLERVKRLDKTLIVVATEFGRPPEFDGFGGRGHYAKAFCGVLAGGGLRTGRAVGVTDELGKKILDRPVSIPDFHATIYCALGIDPTRELYADDRPVPITDHGRPIKELFMTV